MKYRLFAGIVAALSLFAIPASADEQAIIVLDASGSMWGQIDGTPKISIAREVLGNVLGKVPSATYLGLMAYGHREKGNCADIELLIAPAPGSAAEITGMAKDLSPKGKTPLSDAVRQAAEALKYSENKSSVILITDGLETCDADPCAMARELEATGVDFTAHVVGFGLSAEEGRQVACIAEETGGKYIPADNADALVEALSETVADIAEPPPVAEAPVEPAVLPEASLEAPDQVEIGRSFVVAWQGPGERLDSVALFDPAGNNGEGRDVRSRRVVNADFDKKQVGLTAPVTPGTYELQYRYGRDRAVAATRPIEIVEADVSLSAPAGAAIGSTIVVDWVGPGAQRDSIELFDPEARQGEGTVLFGRRVRNGDFDNRKVSLVVPTEPGFYRLRYFNGDDRKVLATREIEVLAAEVSLSSPESVDIGRTFNIEWVGPGARRDSVELYNPAGNNGNGKVVASKRLVNGDFENRTIDLVAPTEAGAYQLRYFNGDSRAVLATRPVEVVATAVSVSAPESVDFGRSFAVGWVGPGGRRDAAEIFDPAGNNGNGRVVYSKRLVNDDFDKQTVTLVAPAKAGEYQIRYWSGDGRAVLATRPVTIVETEVAVTAPDSVAADMPFTAAWVGPGAGRDSIEVVADGKVVKSTRLINGDYDGQTVQIKAPAEPGSYVLRYWSGDSGIVLATRPIMVE